MKAIGANIWQIVWRFSLVRNCGRPFGTFTGLGLGMTLIRFRNEFSHWLAMDISHIEIFLARFTNSRKSRPMSSRWTSRKSASRLL